MKENEKPIQGESRKTTKEGNDFSLKKKEKRTISLFRSLDIPQRGRFVPEISEQAMAFCRVKPADMRGDIERYPETI